MVVIGPGSRVVLREGPAGEPSERIEGTITKVIIDANISTEYLVEYWDNKMVRREWFYPSRIEEIQGECAYMPVDLKWNSPNA